jgi:hypothetical protein
VKPLLIALIFAVASLTAAAPASAGIEALPLKGIRSLSVLIEEVSPNSCGVTKADLETDVRYVLSQSRIKIVDNVFGGYVYVAVTVLDDCSAANVEIAVEVNAVISRTKREELVDIWDKTELLGGRSEMQTRIGDTVEQLTKKLVVDWASVNQ